MSFLRTRERATLAEPLSRNEDAPDDVLVARTQQDPRQFATLYSRYFAGVYGYCFSELHDPEAAADAASLTFLRAMSALDRYRPTNRFRSWLFAIAHNILLDQRRRERPITSLTVDMTLTDPAPRLEESVLMRLEMERLDAALAQLPAEDRRVLELRRAGLRGQEIGEVLGIGHAAARQRQARALDRLRQGLASSAGITTNEATRDF
jgi:RNA polymerase sigma-70 factor, ECF subfamily